MSIFYDEQGNGRINSKVAVRMERTYNAQAREWVEADRSAIQIERTEDFYNILHALNVQIEALGLEIDKQNELAWLIIKQIGAAEIGAFNTGFDVGIKFGAATESAEDEEDESAGAQAEGRLLMFPGKRKE